MSLVVVTRFWAVICFRARRRPKARIFNKSSLSARIDFWGPGARKYWVSNTLKQAGGGLRWPNHWRYFPVPWQNRRQGLYNVVSANCWQCGQVTHHKKKIHTCCRQASAFRCVCSMFLCPDQWCLAQNGLLLLLTKHHVYSRQDAEMSARRWHRP